MLRIIIFLIFLASFTSGVIQSAQAETDFFETLYDVPILNGLEEIDEEAVTFDKPSGRISYAAAYTARYDEEQVIALYKQALAQMGWKLALKSTFMREGEILTISFYKSKAWPADPMVVRFALQPDV